MSRFFIAYDQITGFITRCGTLPDVLVDKILELQPELREVSDLPDPQTQKVDLATGAIIAKSATDLLPMQEVVNIEIQRLLLASDFTQIPDAPFTDTQRESWRVYRQALRDLSKEPNVAAMIAAWPASPDGAPRPFA